MSDAEALLDNPIWNALTTRHSHFALNGGMARRYLNEIGPLSGMAEQSAQGYERLRELAPPGDTAVLFLKEPPQVPAAWRTVMAEPILQMICRVAPIAPDHGYEITPMTAGDVPEMLALTALTKPGPFRARTWELGGFLGIRIDGRLAAITGQRLAPEGFTEVSAVCTHPDYRGRRLAQILVAAVANGIRARGETPFLTVLASNTSAIRVYESAGLEARRMLNLAWIAPE
jgi:GNAT superfamily N-acetyltransferase